jgi:hypothetical protein
MIAIHDIGAHAERQECAGPICTFGLALGGTPVAYERALLVANETSKRHTLKRIIRGITVHLARQDVTCQYRSPRAEEAQKDRIPLECADIEQ